MTDTYSADAKLKIRQIITEGLQVTEEIEMLREGLKDTVKAVSEELNIKVSVLNKAIRTAHKHDLADQVADLDLIESILVAADRGQ